MKPRIAKEIKNTDTGAVTTIEPEEVRQVISKETSEIMLDMLESVVDSGSGRYAQVKGYSIAGKTGTSETRILLMKMQDMLHHLQEYHQLKVQR